MFTSSPYVVISHNYELSTKKPLEVLLSTNISNLETKLSATQVQEFKNGSLIGRLNLKEP